MSFLFRERFAAKKLAGGYLAMNKGQLEQLPIRVVDKGEEGIAARLSKLAGQADSLSHDIDREIDELVYQLYRLTAAEIRQVDTAFEEREAKAA